MKTIHSFAQKLVVGAVAMAVLALACQAGAVEVTAKVANVRNSARVSTDGGKTWQVLKSGDLLKAGSIIQTAERSEVDLILGEGKAVFASSISGSATTRAVSNTSGGGGSEGRANVVRIFESSMLGLDKLTSEETGAGKVEETQLDLRAGRVMGNVKKLSAASRYEIKIPNGVAGIRGTGYDLSSSGVVIVFEGSVVVSYVGADGVLVTVVVDQQYRFDPLVDKQPVKIPDGPIWDQMYNEWRKLTGGTSTPPKTLVLNPTIIYVTPLDGNIGGGSSSTPPPPPPPNNTTPPSSE